jgi:hypothetical protein
LIFYYYDEGSNKYESFEYEINKKENPIEIKWNRDGKWMVMIYKDESIVFRRKEDEIEEYRRINKEIM